MKTTKTILAEEIQPEMWIIGPMGNPLLVKSLSLTSSSVYVNCYGEAGMNIWRGETVEMVTEE